MPFDKGYALVIGIGSYQYESKLDMLAQSMDALHLDAVLRDTSIAGYPPRQVNVLTDSEATRAKILKGLTDLATVVKQDDTVLIFYCGHGMYGVDTRYYLTTHDTKLEDDKVVDGSGIADNEFLQKIREIKASRLFIILNACHSGSLPPSLGGNDAGNPDLPEGIPLPEKIAQAILGTGEGRVIITACRADQRSYAEPDAQTTLFSQVLIDGLRGQGVSNRRGYISLFDLYEHIFETVKAEAKRRWNVYQEPQITIHQGIGVMAVALYQGAKTPGTLGLENNSAIPKGAVREVDPADSRQAITQLLAKSGSIFSGTNVFLGPANITQNFGPHIVNTQGGDYAGGNIDKRQGVFIDGGTTQGSIIGFNNHGNVVSNNEKPALTNPAHTLQESGEHIQKAIEWAQYNRDINLLINLQQASLDIEAAIEAERQGDDEQKRLKLTKALEYIQKSSQKYPLSNLLVQQLQQFL